jgi:molecular chaperone Hsp33
MQKIAPDHARGDPSEDWSRAGILMGSVRDDELVDPDLGADRLLYRLFHEEGVRMGEPAGLHDQCTCSEERLANVLKQFPAGEVRSLVEPDGLLHARCQFCGRKYLFPPEQVLG